MNTEITEKINIYIEQHWGEILNDLSRLIRIPSVAVPGSEEPEPFGKECAKVLKEALMMAKDKGMNVQNCKNWYGLANWGNGPHKIGIFSHLDVVEVVNDEWTYPPFDLTEKDGWLFGRGVADDKIAAVIGMHTVKALEELGIGKNLSLELYLGSCEEKGMQDLDKYLDEQNLPEFSLVPDFMFPGSIGESGSFKFHFDTDKCLNSVKNIYTDKPGKKFTASVRADYVGDLPAAVMHNAEGRSDISVEKNGESVIIHALGKPDSKWGADDSVNAIGVLARFLLESNVLNEKETVFFSCLAALASSKHGECFNIDRNSKIFGRTKCNFREIAPIDGKTVMSFVISYSDEITAGEIEKNVRDYAENAGFAVSEVSNCDPWKIDDDDPMIQILLDCWEAVSGVHGKMKVGGGTYARKLGRAINFGPSNLEKCPFIPKGHGEIHCADETRSIKSVKDALKAYIMAMAEIGEYYSSMECTK